MPRVSLRLRPVGDRNNKIFQIVRRSVPASPLVASPKRARPLTNGRCLVPQVANTYTKAVRAKPLEVLGSYTPTPNIGGAKVGARAVC